MAAPGRARCSSERRRLITAQIEGNEVGYSIFLNKAGAKLSREEVEGRFERELSKK
jgi:hypothetical protein